MNRVVYGLCYTAVAGGMLLGCGGVAPVESTFAAGCDDKVDNDEDGLVDCLDDDCAIAAPCFENQGGETCSDGDDNDGDGVLDCSDPDCVEADACQQDTPEGVDTIDTPDTEPPADTPDPIDTSDTDPADSGTDSGEPPAETDGPTPIDTATPPLDTPVDPGTDTSRGVPPAPWDTSAIFGDGSPGLPPDTGIFGGLPSDTSRPLFPFPPPVAVDTGDSAAPIPLWWPDVW